MHIFYIWQLTRKCLIILTHCLTFWTKANLKYCNDMSIQTLCWPVAGTGTGTGTLLRGRGQAERDRWKPDPDSPGHLRLSHTFTNSRINQKAHRSVLGTPLETSWCGPIRDLLVGPANVHWRTSFFWIVGGIFDFNLSKSSNVPAVKAASVRLCSTAALTPPDLSFLLRQIMRTRSKPFWI